ncbi:MAG: hypothetical protein EOP60_08535 [Sphingomonadales bacterium]|nr:MAG: hypothetical protein EOP60_08535 [Sphingomonadales bacterium]
MARLKLAERWQVLRRHVFGKASLVGLLPVLVALAGSAALNIGYTRSLATTRALVTHSLRVNTAINDVLSAMQDVETGQRGYLITGDAAYLDPYRAGVAAFEPGTARLEKLVRDNPGQGARIARARTLGRRKLAEVDATLAAMRSQGFPAARALVASDTGKRTMDSFRTTIAEMRDAERTLLETRVASMHQTEQRLFSVILLGIALALSARLVAFLLQLRIRRRQRAARQEN